MFLFKISEEMEPSICIEKEYHQNYLAEKSLIQSKIKSKDHLTSVKVHKTSVKFFGFTGHEKSVE
jgi:hypothetical protein